MPTVSYVLYDVFTDTAFAGNPLAIAIDPPPLTTAHCATVARELNLSETVFVWTGGDGGDGYETRIFTPSAELPFAGHPTIGAAIALVDAGLATDHVRLLEGVGAVDVTIDDGVATLTTASPPTASASIEAAVAASWLGLRVDDLDERLAPQVWSAGVPFTMVSVRDVGVIGRISISPSIGREQLYVLAPEGEDAGRWRARMFAPGLGIAEDPATGSAAAAACGFLSQVATEARRADGWTIEQGVEMGRRSVIHVRVVERDALLVAARVGGRAVAIGRGELWL